MKKKILYIITKSNLGGAQRYVLDLATSLPKEAFDVAVAFGGNGILKEKLEEAGIRTYVISHFERDINLWKEIGAMWELAQIIKKEHPDVVHLNSSKAGGSGAFVARLFGVPRIIFTAHGWPFFEERGAVWKTLVWFFSYLTTLLVHDVIVVSQNDLLNARMYGLTRSLTPIHPALPKFDLLHKDAARTSLISHGAHAPSPDALWIGSIAEYVHNKNLLFAIKAVEAVRKKSSVPLFYTIIGVDGGERPLLEKYIQTHNLCNSIQLLGFIDNARSHLPAYDTFILPSLKEGLPYVLLEAGIAGVPIIASNVGGIPEIIDNEINGILVNPKDQRTIESALLTYINDPTLREKYAQKLKVKISSSFCIDKMLESTITLYTS